MATYIIRHECGHTKNHQIYGTNSNGERDRKQEWLKKSDCEDCFKAKIAAKAKEKNAGLPELVGSEKQIAWAEKIRANSKKDLDALKNLFEKHAAENPEMATKFLQIVESTLNNDQAKFWIDNRDTAFTKFWAAQEYKRINNV